MKTIETKRKVIEAGILNQIKDNSLLTITRNIDILLIECLAPIQMIDGLNDPSGKKIILILSRH